jgi:hypothetical protein
MDSSRIYQDSGCWVCLQHATCFGNLTRVPMLLCDCSWEYVILVVYIVFLSWVNSFSLLKGMIRKRRNPVSYETAIFQETELFIIQKAQHEQFSKEIQCIWWYRISKDEIWWVPGIINGFFSNLSRFRLLSLPPTRNMFWESNTGPNAAMRLFLGICNPCCIHCISFENCSCCAFCIMKSSASWNVAVSYDMGFLL